MKSKLKVGIDINEILRAKWLQFDRYYVEEFGEDGVPKDKPYSYNYFETYEWKNTIKVIKELKEPGEMPENINPIDYQIDDSGNALADNFLFKVPEKIELTPKEVYNTFIYEDYCFEIHGSAPIMYKNMDVDVDKFYMKYKDTVDFILMSKENRFSIPPTLFFLSKMNSRFNNIMFFDDEKDMWKSCDILITTNPDLLNSVPFGKMCIKVNRPYNESINNKLITILQLVELIDNKLFEKIIKYKKIK